jgi:DNA repair protein RadC
MEQFLYERPREKLRSRGAGYLTVVELLQIIIGSGGAKASGAKIARQISQVLQIGGSPNNTESNLLVKLMALNGVGVAKASQVLAAIELGRRMSSAQQGEGYEGDKYAVGKVLPVSNEALAASARDGPWGILCVCFDGSMNEVSRKRYIINSREHSLVLIRRIFTDTLAVSAHTVSLAFSIKKTSLTPDIADLDRLKRIKDTAAILGVTVQTILATNKHDYQIWSHEV